jgi:signal peptidase II
MDARQLDSSAPDSEGPPVPQGAAPRWLALALVLLVTVGDRATKLWASRTLAGQPEQVLWGGSVRLVYVENPGAFLSLGADWPPAWRFALLTLGCAFTLLALMGVLMARRQARTFEVVAWAAVLGGGLGNVIDRLWRDGHVIDFMQLALGPLHTGVFNLADVALMAGAGGLLLGLLRAGHEAPAPRA